MDPLTWTDIPARVRIPVLSPVSIELTPNNTYFGFSNQVQVAHFAFALTLHLSCT